MHLLKRSLVLDRCRNMIIIFYPVQARLEPQRGPEKHSRGAPKHFHWVDPSGKKILLQNTE